MRVSGSRSRVGNEVRQGEKGNPRTRSGFKKIRIFTSTALVLILSCGLLLSMHALGAGVVGRVSTDAGGNQVNGDSQYPDVSATGRYVAFASRASNLVPGDTNNEMDVFVKDTATGAVTRVSTDSNGVQGNMKSGEATSGGIAISDDGRYVAFVARASNLVAGDVNGLYDIFLKDTATGMTTLVSADSSGLQANGNSRKPVISADGRFVAFQSYATNLVPGDTNGLDDVFVKDTATGALERVSTSSTGAQGGGESRMPSISADGRYVAFISGVNSLVPPGYSGTSCIFVKDRRTDVTIVINGCGGRPEISGNGRYLTYEYGGVNPGMYYMDLQTGSRTSIPLPAPPGTNVAGLGFTTMSSSGQYVAYVFAPYGGLRDLYVYDAQAAVSTRLTVVSQRGVYNPRISADGRYVAFDTEASNLVPGDTNNRSDIFLATTPLADSCTSAGKPDLVLALDASANPNGVYWKDYAAYAARQLSIDYSVTNNGAETAYAVEVTGSTATNGVSLVTATPLSLGSLMPGSQARVTLDHYVPMGVPSFAVTVSAWAADNCGFGYSY